jgi:hypothetical protein
MWGRLAAVAAELTNIVVSSQYNGLHAAHYRAEVSQLQVCKQQ